MRLYQEKITEKKKYTEGAKLSDQQKIGSIKEYCYNIIKRQNSISLMEGCMRQSGTSKIVKHLKGRSYVLIITLVMLSCLICVTAYANEDAESIGTELDEGLLVEDPALSDNVDDSAINEWAVFESEELSTYNPEELPIFESKTDDAAQDILEITENIFTESTNTEASNESTDPVIMDLDTLTESTNTEAFNKSTDVVIMDFDILTESTETSSESADLAKMALEASDEEQLNTLTLDANGGIFYATDSDGNSTGKVIGDTIKVDVNDNPFHFSYDTTAGEHEQLLYMGCTIHGYVLLRDGYVQTGWIVKETGERYPELEDCDLEGPIEQFSGANLYGGSFDIPIEGNHTLVAIWEPAATIILDYNGGTYKSGWIEERRITRSVNWALKVNTQQGESIGAYELPYLEKESYGLIGWTDLTTGVTYKNHEIIHTDHDMTLQAVWGKEVTITLDPGNKRFLENWRFWNKDLKVQDNGTMTSISYAGRSLVTHFSGYWPEDSKGEYYALEWRIKGDNGGTVYGWSDSITLENDIILEAVWSKKVRVDYDYDGGICNYGDPSDSGYENTVASSEYLVFQYNGGSGHFWKDERMKKKGYTFNGWRVKGSTDNHIYHAGDTYDLQEDTTFIAVWSKEDVPDAPKSVTAKNLTDGIKVTWAKVKGTAGYKVYRNNKLIATIDNVQTLEYLDTSTSNGKKYSYRIVAYTVENGNIISGDKSTAAVIYRLKRPTSVTVKNTASSKMTVKWTRNTVATGYQIQYSLKKTFETKETITVKKNTTVSKVINKLKKGKTYYVRVRAYKTVSGKTYYSAWSTKKSMKISK